MASVLITGTSSGLGLATALAFARAGHTVHATMRQPRRAPELGEVAAAKKLPITISAMDVDSDALVKQRIEQILRESGPIDGLVNNAGIERTGSVEELPLSEFRAVMETNYFGAIRCIQALLPTMRERRNGCIINMSSVAGQIANSPLTPYSASKFALESLSESLAQEVKPFNIRVAIIQPAITDTPMSRRIEASRIPSTYPQQRRFAGFFAAILTNLVPASVVAEKVLEIFDSGTWQLRHPAGPGAEPFLGWRKSMSDEDWVNWGALDDDAWYDRVRADFGVDARTQ
ncbi:MAG TPA: SDR family oxidoreductase [Gemmatimonadales bacterium]|nr:SDR family oxidoreductase [Gemmatimonadales bacterium]